MSNPEQVPQTVKGGLLIVSGFVVVVLAPLAEETFFRGFLYKGLRRRLSVWRVLGSEPGTGLCGACLGVRPWD